MSSPSLVVDTRFLRLPLPAEGLSLERGGVLPQVDVAYEICGTPAADGSNVIFICHALTGDSHVAGAYRGETRDTGWWANMVRPAGGIDTNRFCVICANILGGCRGTTGPASIDPRTGRPYGSMFPDITVGDVVDVHWRLLRALGFERIFAIIGGSFGGMQALVFAQRHPDFAQRIACIASGAAITTQALAFDTVGREAILSDPNFRGGDYYGHTPPSIGLSQARKLAHITYLSNEILARKFGRNLQKDDPLHRDNAADDNDASKPRFQIESYLDHQGEKFIGRFDANSYLRITGAMDSFDLAKGHASLADAFAPIAARMLVVSLSGDWLFLPKQSDELVLALRSAGKRVSHFCLDAVVGHDAFLTNIEELQHVLAGFLEPEPVRPNRELSHDDKRDWDAIAELVPRNATRLLEAASGSGELLNYIATRRPELLAAGIDLETPNGCAALAAGHDAVLGDAEKELVNFPADAFDCAILSESLQVMRRPDLVVKELLRIAPTAIVSFPNFGLWKVRASLLFRGRMPVTRRLPWQWYDTPNIHLCTTDDFIDFCKKNGYVIERVRYQSTLTLSWVFRLFGRRNLGSSRAIFRIARGK